MKGDYIKINKKYWDQWSKEQGPWSKKCSEDSLKKARQSQAEIFITPAKPVPRGWLPASWKGLDVLGLAAAGGQQAPVLAAAGARVTSFDFSGEQLKKDLEVCQKHHLKIRAMRGHLESLGAFFKSESFDFIINPISTCYIKNPPKMYKEVFGILRKGGCFITAFSNPAVYTLDFKAYDNGELKMAYSIPYSDLQALSEKEIQAKGFVEFGHSLDDLIGGLTCLGFKITGFYEDRWGPAFNKKIDSIMPQFIALKAVK